MFQRFSVRLFGKYTKNVNISNSKRCRFLFHLVQTGFYIVIYLLGSFKNEHLTLFQFHFPSCNRMIKTKLPVVVGSSLVVVTANENKEKKKELPKTLYIKKVFEILKTK